ncbi:MAG TPA: pirin family protein [Woeseiaceae bacterium]|nr:pirin family protein [Woeseiaceae bacterium]
MKQVTGVQSAPGQHWVGDGFPVRSLFSYQTHGSELSPFLLLDYAGPRDFAAAERPRGVGQHPHRGFETVTIVYQGEVEHRDSTGGGGMIGPGEVQWMTAGGGLLHEEFHSRDFTRKGGTFEVVQLWVNLPARNKMTEPAYQAIGRDSIPEVSLPDDAGSMRIIAGEYDGHKGPARTFSPMHVWDMRLRRDATATFEVPEGWTTAIVVLHGTVLVNGAEVVREAQFALLDRSGTAISIEANNDATLLFLSGEPIEEPIVGYGPFVMNTREQIHQAMEDFNSGRFGSMPG